MAKYNHVEAFCLMEYATSDGTEREILWNSRDGVTPFVLHSRSGREMQHVNFQNDICVPGHEPTDGQRVFVDATPELMRDQAVEFVNKHWDRDEMPMRDHGFLGPMGKDGAVEHFIKTWCEPGKPHVIVWNAAMKASRGTP